MEKFFKKRFKKFEKNLEYKNLNKYYALDILISGLNFEKYL